MNSSSIHYQVLVTTAEIVTLGVVDCEPALMVPARCHSPPLALHTIGGDRLTWSPIGWISNSPVNISHSLSADRCE